MQTNRHRQWWALAALVLLAALAACKSKSDEASKSDAPAAEMGAARATSAASSAAAPKPGGAKQKGDPKTWKRSAEVTNAARLRIGDREELPSAGSQIGVWVDGFRARVVIDYFFVNDRSSRFEGTFQLRLPSEASLFYFAFGETTAAAKDPPPYLEAGGSGAARPAPETLLEERKATWKAPREARVVPKEAAAKAYGDTVRASVDPALAEWAGAGVFNARVFPLEPGKIHRIVVAYDVDLVPLGDGLELSVALPAGSPRNIADVTVLARSGERVEIEPTTTPKVAGGRVVAHFDDAKGELKVRIAKATRLAIAGEDGAGSYFAARALPKLPADKPAPARSDSAREGIFLVDTSLSANPDSFNVQLSLLEKILSTNRDSMTSFGVVFFDIGPRFYKTAPLANDDANVKALLAYARTLSLEGATDLGAALRAAVKPPWPANPAGRDLFLLSDASATWGESDALAISKSLRDAEVPLFGYQTGLAGVDTGMLAALARESGGAVFSVTGESELAAAAKAHRAIPWELASVRVDGVTDLVIAGRPRAVFPGQVLSIAGRGTPRSPARAVLSLRRGKENKDIDVDLGGLEPSPLAARAFGQIATAQLEELGDATVATASHYAQHFRVTGKTCSLLMLETEADYARRGVRAEDAAATVKDKPASIAVDVALRERWASLGDPKATHLAWLRKMETIDGVSLKLLPELVAAIERLPATAFRVDAPPLEIRAAESATVPGAYFELLALHKIDVDSVETEAERRRASVGAPDALRALSSLVEENPGDGVLARDIGFTAMEWGLGPHAFHLFRRVADARPYEPQTYRAMAATLARTKHLDLALIYYEVGLSGSWDARFGDFAEILAFEYLRFLRSFGSDFSAELTPWATSRRTALEERVKPARADLVVLITWNTDSTDVDLHVLEPSGEDCHFAKRTTKSGGSLTRDVTRGYGPEMYVIPSAPAGTYKIRAHYYASDRNRASARSKVHALVVSDWGTDKETVLEKVVVLETGKREHDIATVTRGAAE